MTNDNLAKRSDLHLKRRIWHVLCGVICLTLYYTTNSKIIHWGYFSLFIAFLGFIIDFQRFKNEKLNDFLGKHFGPIMRKSERLNFSGLPFYALGVALSIFLYDEKIATLSILYLIFSDPIASIFGVYFGRDVLLPNKTLQGTIAAFVTCLVVTLIYFYILEIHSPNIIIFAFLASMFGALSEIISAFNIDDNLTIPVVSGAVLTGLNVLFNVF